MVEKFIGDHHKNKEIVEFISLQPFPLVWTRHYNFFKSEDFGVPPFIFINIVRDPEKIVPFQMFLRDYFLTLTFIEDSCVFSSSK
jgi:hypothetical protein